MQRREFLASSLAAAAALAIDPLGSEVLAASSSAAAGSRLILYLMAQLTGTDSSSLRSAIDTLGPSGFQVVVLSFLQASVAGGDGRGGGKLILLYNDQAISSFLPGIAELLARLRSGYGTQKRIQISIGGWGHTPTFAAIRSVGVAAFVRQLTEEVIVPLGLDGIDLDLEPQQGGLENWRSVHQEYGSTLVDLTNAYKRLHPRHLVTHAPISGMAAEMYVKPAEIPGVGGSLLEATRGPQGNHIDWLNVQFYEGGQVTEGSIADYYRAKLAGPLWEQRDRFGIMQPLHFLTPTFEPAAKQPVQFCRETLAAIDARCADLHGGRLNGVALWDYHQIATRVEDWAGGLQSALNG